MSHGRTADFLEHLLPKRQEIDAYVNRLDDGEGESVLVLEHLGEGDRRDLRQYLKKRHGKVQHWTVGDNLHIAPPREVDLAGFVRPEEARSDEDAARRRPGPPGPRRVRVVSFNIPMGVSLDSHPISWRHRVDCAAAQLARLDCSVAGLQEVRGAKLFELLQRIPRLKCATNPHCFQPIVYDPSVARPLEWGRLVLSDRPIWKYECTCGTQYASSCKCGERWAEGAPRWVGGATTWCAFELADAAVRFVVVNSHVSQQSPEVRARAVREVLAPLVRALGKRYGRTVPIILTGDFNAAKDQSGEQSNKTADASGTGEHAALCGIRGARGSNSDYRTALREWLARERRRVVRGQVRLARGRPGRGRGDGYDSTDDEFYDFVLEHPCVDTWDVARKPPTANGCFASTCHQMKGLRADQQHAVAGTQGVGANRVYCDENHSGRSTKRQKLTYGSDRYIDWVLVSSPAFVEGTAAVLDAEVHTKQCAPWSADNTTRYGSDHYPVSVDFELHPNQ